MGGEAVANTDNVADFDGAERLIQTAIDTVRRRERAGQQRRHPARPHAGQHVRSGVGRRHPGPPQGTLRADALCRPPTGGSRARPGAWSTPPSSTLLPRPACSTTPARPTTGPPRPGITSLTIIAQKELERYGVRVNAIAPSAWTRLIATVPGAQAPEDSGEWSSRDPSNIAPFVAYLCTADCPIKGRVFLVSGGDVYLFQPFAIIDEIHKDGQWTIEELQKEAAHLADDAVPAQQPDRGAWSAKPQPSGTYEVLGRVEAPERRWRWGRRGWGTFP